MVHVPLSVEANISTTVPLAAMPMDWRVSLKAQGEELLVHKTTFVCERGARLRQVLVGHTRRVGRLVM